MALAHRTEGKYAIFAEYVYLEMSDVSQRTIRWSLKAIRPMQIAAIGCRRLALHDSSVGPDRRQSMRYTVRISHRCKIAKKKKAEELIKILSHTTWNCFVLHSKPGRPSNRSFPITSNNDKAMHATAEQDNASHGWAHVKAQYDNRNCILRVLLITSWAPLLIYTTLPCCHNRSSYAYPLHSSPLFTSLHNAADCTSLYPIALLHHSW